MKELESDAFCGCWGITEIIIPDSIEKIGNGAFRRCINAAVIRVPDRNMEFGEYIFSGCSGLTGIDGIIPTSMTKIPANTFSGCNGLTEVTIPAHITDIGARAFWGCKNLKKVTIPGNVKKMDEGVFGDCESLVDVSMAEGIETLGNNIFTSCSALEEISLADSITEMGKTVFHNCGNLKRVKLPLRTSVIKESTFMYCPSLEELTLPCGVRQIDELFSGCGKLDKLKIPVAITEEGEQKQVSSFILKDARYEFSFGNCAPVRHLMFLSEDGQKALQGSDFETARAAYLSVNDGNVDDEYWFGWKIDPLTIHTITAAASAGGRIVPDGNIAVAQGNLSPFRAAVKLRASETVSLTTKNRVGRTKPAARTVPAAKTAVKMEADWKTRTKRSLLLKL